MLKAVVSSTSPAHTKSCLSKKAAPAVGVDLVSKNVGRRGTSVRRRGGYLSHSQDPVIGTGGRLYWLMSVYLSVISCQCQLQHYGQQAELIYMHTQKLIKPIVSVFPEKSCQFGFHKVSDTICVSDSLYCARWSPLYMCKYGHCMI